MKTEILESKDQNDIVRASQIITEGGTVAFPTETVYGLGADAFNPEAVKKIFAAKGRASDHPITVLIDSFERVDTLARSFPEEAQLLAKLFWPGPLTLILPKNKNVPDIVSGGLDTIGIRMPRNDSVLSLISKADRPLAAPSANISGRPSPTRAKDVLDDLEGKISAILLGDQTDYGMESTIVDATGPEMVILRPGVLTEEMLQSAMEKPIKTVRASKRIGDKYKHYAPKVPVTLVTGNRKEQRKKIESLLESERRYGILTIGYNQYEAPSINLGKTFFEREKNLYAGLHTLENEPIDEILIECPSNSNNAKLFLDRIRQASAGRKI